MELDIWDVLRRIVAEKGPTAPTPSMPSAETSAIGSAWGTFHGLAPRAIHAYEKLGFRSLDLPLESARELWGPNDSPDSVYTVRTIV